MSMRMRTAATEEAAAEREHVLRLELRNMHCPGCAENMGGPMNRIEGVQSAIAAHERGVVEITHIESKVREGELRDHLRELGYEVTGHAEHGLINDQQQRKKEVAS